MKSFSKLNVTNFNIIYSNIQKRILHGKYHPIYKMNKEIDNISFNDLKEFAKNWTKELKMQCIFQGNILISQVFDIMKNLTDSLNPAAIKDVSTSLKIITLKTINFIKILVVHYQFPMQKN